MSIDEKWMHRALQLALRGRGHVHPNPMVGAVVVKNGRRVSEGYHHAFGQDHAEIDALERAGARARGATLYVNLEPCSHFGKTGPCATAVIAAGVRRVVSAMQDPNPKVAGKGFAALRRAGVTVVRGTGEKEAQELNRGFIRWIKSRRPYVTLKAAVSLDGKTAAISGDSKWITSRTARQRGHGLRARVDAIAVGVETILKDNPSLTAHESGRNPVRVIFDSHLRTPTNSHVLNRAATTWILTRSAISKKRRPLEKKGARILEVATDPSGRLDLAEALRALASNGIGHLMVEGGKTLAESFLRERAVDEIAWFIAPIILGSAKRLKDAIRLSNVQMQRVGPDFFLQAEVV